MPILFSFTQLSARGVGGTLTSYGPITVGFNPPTAATRTPYTGYFSLEFTSSGTLTLSGSGGGGAVDLLLVGGGFTGGNGSFAYYPVGNPAYDTSYQYAGPGGPGGKVSQTAAFLDITPYPVVVGSTASNSTLGTYSSNSGTIYGGGGGAGYFLYTAYGTGAYSASNGGSGFPNTYKTGSPLVYGGGGGGGSVNNYPGGSGGAGGGGPGGQSGAGTPGTANTGGGGGGHGPYTGSPGVKGGEPFPVTSPGGAGASGVVIIRFPTERFV